MKRGLFIRRRGDILMIAPPLVITTAEIDQLVGMLADSVIAVLG